jgi:prepilin-type N-terminal cleavage/methylation domain-containing protein
VRTSNTLPRNAGLTLIEVLTAVSLMGILTAVAATNFTAMRPSFRTRAAALAVAGDLNQARMAAIKEGRFYQYFPISGGYQIRRDNNLGGVEVVKEVVIANDYDGVTFGRTGITNDPYGTAITSSSPTATITFQSDGSVLNPAGVFVQASGYDGPVQQAVTLSAAGRVRVWKFGGSGWQ